MDIAQIVSIAKQKVGSTSLSDRTFTDYFTAVNLQAEPDDAFWNQHTAILKSLSGQYSHDIAEWQKGHPVQQPTVHEPTAPQGITPEVQQILDGYKAQMDQMSALLVKQQSMATEQQIRTAGIANGTALKATKIQLWNDIVGRTPVTEGMTQEQFNASVKATYEQNLQFFGDGIQGYGEAAPADTSAATKKALDDFFASKGMGAN